MGDRHNSHYRDTPRYQQNQKISSIQQTSPCPPSPCLRSNFTTWPSPSGEQRCQDLLCIWETSRLRMSQVCRSKLQKKEQHCESLARPHLVSCLCWRWMTRLLPRLEPLPDIVASREDFTPEMMILPRLRST